MVVLATRLADSGSLPRKALEDLLITLMSLTNMSHVGLTLTHLEALAVSCSLQPNGPVVTNVCHPFSVTHWAPNAKALWTTVAACPIV